MLISRRTYTYAYLLKDTYLFRFFKGHIYIGLILILVLRISYLYYGTYSCISYLIFVFRNLFLYFRSYTCITELILVFRILFLYFGSYTCITELILVFHILYLFKYFSRIIFFFFLFAFQFVMSHMAIEVDIHDRFSC